MSLTEFDQKQYDKWIRHESYEEGLKADLEQKAEEAAMKVSVKSSVI